MQNERKMLKPYRLIVASMVVTMTDHRVNNNSTMDHTAVTIMGTMVIAVRMMAIRMVAIVSVTTTL